MRQLIAPLPTPPSESHIARADAYDAHLVGMGGTGMQALAHVLAQRGWRLSGSDSNPAAVGCLRRQGYDVYSEHDEGNVPSSLRRLIYSDAVPESNPERRAAAGCELLQSSYAQVVGELMSQHRGLAVAGTHGKSTTTAMLAEILVGAGYDPTVICGAAPHGLSSGGRAGEGSWFLAEACEYRENFLHLRPEMAVILGIEHDHVDYFSSLAAVQNGFARFCQRVRDGGQIIANVDCPVTAEVVKTAGCRLSTFALASPANWQATDLRHENGRFRFTIHHRGNAICQAQLQVPGRHQVSNALAAAAAAFSLGVQAEEIAAGLARFAGLQRRLEFVSQAGGVDFWDDYAHHPTEVRAALAALRLIYPQRKIWCVFQPHQVSRTLALVDEFAASLHNADRIAVATAFVARETPVITPQSAALRLACRIRETGGIVLPDCQVDAIVNNIAAAVQPGDVVITLGAGDIRNCCHELIDRL